MKAIKACRACGSVELIEFLDLGKQYLSDFRQDDSKPPKHPLTALLCDDCKLVQLKHTTPQEQMYHENYGFKSGINDKIIIDLDDAVTHAFQYCNDPKNWLDIGSNDGTLLSFVPTDVYRVGIDPVGFLCVDAEASADRIIKAYFNLEPFYYYEPSEGQRVHDSFDVITTVSCFYDMPDLSKFVHEVETLLAPKGVWVIQQNYLLTTMKLKAVDNFCHEHLTYFTLLSLEKLLGRFGLEVNEVYLSDINGGSIRTIVSRAGDYAIDESVSKQRLVEADYGLANLSSYREFAEEIGDNLNQLLRLVTDLRAEAKSIAILAASTRGATIWQSIGLSPELVDYAVERNPAKVGRYFSAIGIPIISEDEFLKLKPDFAIIGPWFFADGIIERSKSYLENGGKLIVPLPEVKVIDERTSDIHPNV